MKFSIIIPAVLGLFSFSACSQSAAQKQSKPANTIQIIGGGFDGCEGIYQQAPSFDNLDTVNTPPDSNESGPEIEISGIVYQRDEKLRPRILSSIFIIQTREHYKSIAMKYFPCLVQPAIWYL